jgi:hypothetical protein
VVPDFSGQFRISDSWVTAGNVGEVIARLARAVEVSPPSTEHQLEADLGSRLAMRSMGLLVPSRKVPIRLVVEAVRRDQGTQVMVQAVSNQGWYAMSSSRFTSRTYDRAFGELMDTLRQAAPPA